MFGYNISWTPWWDKFIVSGLVHLPLGNRRPQREGLPGSSGGMYSFFDAHSRCLINASVAMASM